MMYLDWICCPAIHFATFFFLVCSLFKCIFVYLFISGKLLNHRNQGLVPYSWKVWIYSVYKVAVFTTQWCVSFESVWCFVCVQVKDEKHECSLGTFSIPLSKLLQEDQMTISQRFPLRNSGPGSSLKMKIALRVTHTHTNISHTHLC